MLAIPNRILIADDHRSTRHFLQRIIESWGFEVVAVEDGEAALQILQSDEAPPLAILDWMMPKLDGVKVCAGIRRANKQPYIYVVMLTALSKKTEVAAGLEAGADDYVSKPFDSAELHARIRAGQRVVMLERTLQGKVDELQTALADVKKLKHLLPICTYCKNIRDDQDYWHQIEEYIHTETGADFSHGICPDCMAKLEAELEANGGGVDW
jgi:sigma-B regulation protein RsbU (phosphoserine phosphatase)